MKRLMVTLASLVITGGTLASGTALSAAPAANSDSSSTADTARDQRVEEHIKEMHKELSITDAEQAQWDHVAQTMRENAKRLDKAIDERKASISEHETAVDDLNSYAQLAETHAENVKRLADAFSSLYSSMSDEQKREADKVFNRRAREARSARNAHSGEASTTQH